MPDMESTQISMDLEMEKGTSLEETAKTADDGSTRAYGNAFFWIKDKDPYNGLKLIPR